MYSVRGCFDLFSDIADILQLFAGHTPTICYLAGALGNRSRILACKHTRSINTREQRSRDTCRNVLFGPVTGNQCLQNTDCGNRAARRRSLDTDIGIHRSRCRQRSRYFGGNWLDKLAVCDTKVDHIADFCVGLGARRFANRRATVCSGGYGR